MSDLQPDEDREVPVPRDDRDPAAATPPDEGSPARGVLDEDDPDPPEPNEPA